VWQLHHDKRHGSDIALALRGSVGISATTSEFGRLNGQDLRDGSLITIANTFRDEPAPFDTESLTLGTSLMSAGACKSDARP
jgi:hypothetical protein